MQEDIAEHSQTCINCQVLQQAKKTRQIPNATVHLEIHGPFVSYGENKFVVTLTEALVHSSPWMADHLGTPGSAGMVYILMLLRVART